jgi:hypothetical protein
MVLNSTLVERGMLACVDYKSIRMGERQWKPASRGEPCEEDAILASFYITSKERQGQLAQSARLSTFHRRGGRKDTTVDLSESESEDADLGKDLDQKLLTVSELERFLVTDLKYRKTREKIVWIEGVEDADSQEIEIRTYGGFRAAVLSLRKDGNKVLRCIIVKKAVEVSPCFVRRTCNVTSSPS